MYEFCKHFEVYLSRRASFIRQGHGGGGGLVVSIQAVYSGVSSSNPAHTLIVLVKSDISNKKIIGERGHGWQMQAKEF